MTQQEKKQFFNELAIACNMNGVASVKELYYGFIRGVTRQLKENSSVQMPDFGTLFLKIHKGRNIGDVNTGEKIFIPSQPVIKFKPDYKLRAYFKN